MSQISNQEAEIASQSMGNNLRKSSFASFLRATLPRDFSFLDCAAGTQSRANQFGRKGTQNLRLQVLTEEKFRRPYREACRFFAIFARQMGFERMHRLTVGALLTRLFSSESRCSPVSSSKSGECYAIILRGLGHRGLTFVSSLETAFGAPLIAF